MQTHEFDPLRDLNIEEWQLRHEVLVPAEHVKQY